MERCRTGSLHHWHVDFSSPPSAPSAGLPLLDLGMGFLGGEKGVKYDLNRITAVAA